MKKIFNINQKIRIISNNYQEISQGIITEIGIEDFTVLLENKEASHNFVGEKIEISLTSQLYLIKFMATITQILDNNKICISSPKEFKKIQRREYTRINIQIPVTFVDKTTQNLFEAHTTNLSGGGMQILHSQNIPIKTILNAKLQLKQNKFIEAVFEIQRSEKGTKENDFLIAGTFEKISNVNRIAIIQLCFKRHLELRTFGFKDNYAKGGKNH